MISEEINRLELITNAVTESVQFKPAHRSDAPLFDDHGEVAAIAPGEIDPAVALLKTLFVEVTPETLGAVHEFADIARGQARGDMLTETVMQLGDGSAAAIALQNVLFGSVMSLRAAAKGARCSRSNIQKWECRFRKLLGFKTVDTGRYR